MHPLKPIPPLIFTYFNLYIVQFNHTKECRPQHIYTNVNLYMSGSLINLWDPANPLFLRNKYVTPTGKKLYIGYIQKAEANKKVPAETTACV